MISESLVTYASPVCYLYGPGLDHLVVMPALKPYMHDYFLALTLYDAARVIANPYIHAEHREKVIKEKMDKLSESRIRVERCTKGEQGARREDQARRRAGTQKERRKVVIGSNFSL